MIIASISGPCGSGKSSILKFFNDEYELLETTYKKCAGAKLNPKSYESKIDYTAKWFDEINKIENRDKIYISDRSPYDCLAYLSENVVMYKLELEEKFNLLRNNDIKHVPILITAQPNILQSRIRERYTRGERSKELYNQELKALSSSLEFFEENIAMYEVVIDNSKENIKQTTKRLKSILSKIKHDS